MSIDLSKTAEISGFVGACLVDAETGLMLTSVGGGGLDLETVAAAGTEVLRAEHSALGSMGLDDGVDEIIVTLGRQIHILRPLARNRDVLLLLLVDRATATLGLARLQLAALEAALEV